MNHPPRKDTTPAFQVNPRHTVLVGVLIAFAIVFVVLLLATILGWRRCVRTLPSRDEKRHVDRRRRTIRQWTITKPAVDQEHSETIPNRPNVNFFYPSDEEEDTDETLSKRSTTFSLASVDYKAQTCGICLESFHAGERVSWSSTSKCRHAFHPFCIQEWLIRHENCPICRQRFMLCDFAGKHVPKERLRAQRAKYKERERETYFCIHNGLMARTGIDDDDKWAEEKDACSCPTCLSETRDSCAIHVEKGCDDTVMDTTMSFESDEEVETSV